jgi:very-short-patch-repair endonuclease
VGMQPSLRRCRATHPSNLGKLLLGCGRRGVGKGSIAGELREMPNDRHNQRWRMSGTKQQRARQFRREQTPAEVLLWERLRDRQLDRCKFRRQHVINGFIVDFCCLERHLVIEIDGSIHIQQLDYDAERDALLETLGYRVIRYTNEQVMQHLEAVLASISQHLAVNR